MLPQPEPFTPILDTLSNNTLTEEDCLDHHTFAILMHGDSPHVKNCIESLLNQSIRSKVILVSSTPSDFQRRLADKFELPLHINPAHNGIAQDWNFAKALPDTLYITLAHQDDEYAENYTECMLKALSQHQDALICFSDYRHHGLKKKHPPLLWIKKAILMGCYGFGVSGYKLRSRFFKRLLIGFANPICCPSVTYHRNNTASIKFNPDFRVNLDWKYWIDLAAIHGSFIYVPKNLLTYRAHDETSTNQALASGRRQQEDKQCFELLWPKPLAWLLSKLYSLGYSEIVR